MYFICEKLSDYKTFGVEKNWLVPFLEYIDGERRSDLGSSQFAAMQQWMKHAELVVREGKKGVVLSELGRKIKQMGADNVLTWAVIWVNLCRNSPVVKWYVNSLVWGEEKEKNELLTLMKDTFTNSERTLKNALDALINLLSKSPLGEEMGLGEVKKKKGKGKFIYKKGWDNPSPYAILYSLYRYAEKKGKYELTVRELYEKEAEEGPYIAFGIEKKELQAILCGLASRGDGFVSVDIVKDLDNIFLNPAIKAEDILIYKETCQ